jgi:hypothetical protein
VCLLVPKPLGIVIERRGKMGDIAKRRAVCMYVYLYRAVGI